MTTLDEAENKLQDIYKDIQGNIANIRSEEDAKIQIINRILNECLGWPFSDFRAETRHDNGYSDYILVDNEKRVLLIEAKRIGVIEIKVANKNAMMHLKITGTALKGAMKGIDQAAQYSLQNGIPITVLTDGIVWILFKTFIPNENFKAKEAIVFPSLEAIVSNFSIFFDLLSKQQYRNRVYNSIFDVIHHNRLLLTQALVAPIDELNIKLSQRSDISFDLERVFANFFSRLTGDNDEDLLIECFVETHQSRIADFSLEKIAASVLVNISTSNKDVDNELVNLIESNVEAEIESSLSESGQTIFIVGPTGAGKTTFLNRFFCKTLPALTRKKCVLIQVNCLDSTGRDDIALDWMTESLILSLEKEIYKNGSPEWNDLVGLYHIEYEKRAKGVDSKIYKRDKNEFKEKFGIYLEEQVENDREGYLRRVLTNVVKSRKMLPIILIDNTDEFSIEYKQKLFQFSQALRRHANHCLIIFPVTDKSAWDFSKTDLFGIYQSRSFFLPTPSPREVFRKRINYLKKKLEDEKSNKMNKGNYFSGRGIRISIGDLNGFAQVLESIFVDQDYTSKTIGEVTNYNIRRTLALSQRIITSSVLKIEDLISSFVRKKLVTIDFTIFTNALMKGNYEIYKQGDNHEIYPIFQVDNEVRQSPLLKLRILTLLNTARNNSRPIEEKHLDLQSVVNYFDSMGTTEAAVDRAIISLLQSGLVEPYDISNRELSNDLKLAISYRGMTHLRLASFNKTFFYQMALTTAITNEDTALKIRSIYKSGKSDRDIFDAINTEFINYLLQEDALYISIASELDQYTCQKELKDQMAKFIRESTSDDNDLVATYGAEYKDGTIKEGVIATVDYYDSVKGFGFVEVEGIDPRIFVHAKKLEEHDINVLKDGDDILCDIARGSKGAYIETIYDIETDVSKIQVVKCHISRLFLERGYGYVKLNGSERSALFYVSVFPADLREYIREEQFLEVEIFPVKKGSGFQVKHILSVVA